MNARKTINLILILVFALVLLGSPAPVAAQDPFFTISACPVCHWVTLPSGSDQIGLQIDLTIKDLNGTTIFSGTDSVLLRNPDFAAAYFDLAGIELLPGFTVTATVPSVPGFSKSMVVSPLELTGWDVTADTISGIATAGKSVNIWIMTSTGPEFRIATADAITGEWIADFSKFDTTQGGTRTINVDLGIDGGASEFDANNNNTWANWGIPGPNFKVRAQFGDSVEAFAWPTGATITLTIDNPNTAINPDYTGTNNVSGENTFQSETYAYFTLDNIFDIQPGFFVKITDGTYTRTYTVTDLHFTNWNKTTMDTNIVTGAAQPAERVEIWACPQGDCENSVRRSVIADESGSWTADFNSTGGDPELDLIYGTFVDSEVRDEFGQKTMYGRWIPFQSPVAEAGQDIQAKEGIAFSLDASGSYSEFGDPLTYAWDFDSDGEYDDASGVSTSLLFPDNVTLIFGLKVTDPFEWSNTDTVQVTVVNVSPSISPLKIIIGQNGNISGTGSFTDPGTDSPWTGMINYGDNYSKSLSLKPGKTFSFDHRYFPYGTYRIIVCITDKDGGSGCSPTMVKVYNNPPPIAEAGGPYYGNEGSRIILDAKYSVGQEDSISLYEWDFDDDGQYDDATGSKVTFTPVDDGTYTVRVRVTDAGNLTNTDSAKVNVSNMPPVISSITAKNGVQVWQPYNVEVKFSDPGVNDSFTAVWDWGDHTSTTVENITGQNPLIISHVYTYAGVFTVTVTITDNSKAKAVSTRSVTVQNIQ